MPPPFRRFCQAFWPADCFRPPPRPPLFWPLDGGAGMLLLKYRFPPPLKLLLPRRLKRPRFSLPPYHLIGTATPVDVNKMACRAKKGVPTSGPIIASATPVDVNKMACRTNKKKVLGNSPIISADTPVDVNKMACRAHKQKRRTNRERGTEKRSDYWYLHPG